MSTMNLRMAEELSRRLKEQAEEEGVSMNALAAKAIEQYLARNARQTEVTSILAEEMPRWAELMERLK